MASETVYFQKLNRLPLWKRTAQNRTPLQMDLEITARCNNHCVHCYINQPENDAGLIKSELSFEKIKDIADQAADLGVLWCLLTGGEPLLRKDFLDIYQYLKKKGFLVSVFTNATLVTPEHVRLFQSFPPRNLEVTVYGITRETYEKVTRTPGSFDLFTKGLDQLKSGGTRIGLKAVAMRANFHELSDIFAFCRSNTDTDFRFDPFLQLRFDGDPQRNREIKSQRLSGTEIVALEKADLKRLNALIRFCEKNIRPDLPVEGLPLIMGCGAGRSGFSVGNDGCFRLCASLHHPATIFNLNKMSLADIWRRHVPEILDMDSENPLFHEKCAACSLVNLCMWCPATAFLETGCMDMPVEAFCEMARLRLGATHPDETL